MAATVEVIIQGLAICYRKQVEGKNVWRVLFPFDKDCHTIKFSASTKPGMEIDLAGARRQIKIATDDTQNSSAEATRRFEKTVFDLTSADTHAKLRAKKMETDSIDWDENGVLLTIENVRLNLDRPLRIRRKPEEKELELILTDKNGTKKKTLGETAYSIRGEFQLKAGGKVMVTEGRTTIFETASDEDCILTLDNDCNDPLNRKPDMEMFYNLIVNPDDPTERFFVVSKEKPETAITSENNNIKPKNIIDELIPMTTGGDTLLASGDKPCLSVQVGKKEVADALP